MKKLLMIMSLIFVFNGTAQAAMTREQALSNFIKGDFAYKDAHYDEAINIYEDIVKSGWESGGLYYNLGNSYVKKEKWGKAILNFERAGMLIPRDGDLKANYDYAVSKSKVQLLETRNWFQRQYKNFLNFYTFNELIVVISLLIILAMTLHLVFLYFDWPMGRRWIILLFLAGLVVLYGVSTVVKFQSVHNVNIVIADCQAKFEPREEGTTYFDLFQGEKIRVTSRAGLWIKIQRIDGRNGWIKLDNIEGVFQSSKKRGIR